LFSMSTDDLVRRLFAGATGPAARIDVDSLSDGRARKIDPYPAGRRVATQSGKLQFDSAMLAAEGLPSLPDYREEREDDGDLAERWPLRLLTAPGYFQSHTAFSGNRTLRAREGAPVCVLNPVDADVRGVKDGDAVDLMNDLGRVTFVLRVSDEVTPGVALVAGQRPSGDAIAGTI